MDPFEEFEFKPLTDGLGFQKKASGLKAQTRQTQMVERELDRKIPTPPPENFFDNDLKSPRVQMTDLLKALEPMPGPDSTEKSGSQLSSVLARPEVAEPRKEPSEPAPNSPVFPFPEPGPAIRNKNFISDETGVRRGASDDPRFQLVKVPTCFRAALLDFIMVTALSLLFLVSLLLITGVSLQLILKNIQIDLTAQLSCGLLFVAVMQMYVVISRSFFGRTLGEWTFDFQLGEDSEHGKMMYPIKVAWRSLIVCLTGILTLPLLSLLFRVDLAAYLSGLQLYRQKPSSLNE